MRMYELINEGVPQLVKQDVAEGSKNLSYIGNCTDDDVIEHIFGDATNFAQAVEEHGDEFTIDDLVVKYDPESDIHSFYYKKQGVAEGDIVKFKQKPSDSEKYARAFSKQHDDKHRYGVGQIECPYCGDVNCDYDCDESQAGGFNDENA